jgi:hypothetical protein
MIRKSMYSFAALIALLSLAALISAQDKATLTGYVIDKACEGNAAKKPDVMAAVAGHSKKCALMDNCVASGYGVYSDGKYYEFDAKGNELAKALIEKSSKEKGIKVSVEGTVDGSKVMVSKISEAD